jgi:hypothetical protein
MGEERRIGEQRTSFRCTVADTRRHCELIVGADVLPAQLLDESAGGFSVLVDRLDGLGIDQEAELRTDSGWFAVRVVYVTEVALPDADGATADQQTPGFRLGLLRRSETALPDQSTLSILAERMRFHLPQWRMLSGAGTAIGVLLAVALVVVPMVLDGVRWHTPPSTAKRSSPGNKGGAESVTSYGPPILRSMQSAENVSPFAGSPAESRDGGSAPAAGDTAFGVDSGRVRTSAQSSSLSWQELQKTVRRLSGATSLALPQVVAELRLTADQQARIARVIETTSQAMRDIERELPGQQRQDISELRTQLQDHARQQALELLTSQQRARWEKLTGEQ